MNKTAQKRRERLFRRGKPIIRPAVYEDIKWLWAAAKKAGFEGTPVDFTAQAEPFLASADSIFMLEDSNREFKSGKGPVGVVLCNYDDWSLCPHAEWFPWANSRNKLRCTVGFLQAMRYTRDVGCIKIYANEDNHKWFKWLKRYVAISFAGRIPHGRAEGTESIFYLRGRKQHERSSKSIRRQSVQARESRTAIASSQPDFEDKGRQRVTH